MEKQQYHYPESGVRVNCYAKYYAEIALDSYIHAKKVFRELSDMEDNIDMARVTDYIGPFNKHYFCSAVFSCMCMESCMNDYLASCLDDDRYIDVFDNLSFMSKLELVTVLLHQEPINKDRCLYGRAKKAFKLRNELVHNKSRNDDFIYPSKNQSKEATSAITDLDNEIEEAYKRIKSEVKSDLQSILFSLEAIAILTQYIDEFDSHANEKLRVFGYAPNSIMPKIKPLTERDRLINTLLRPRRTPAW